ncbi:helix-turn-helix domain-containing protein [Cytobacillus kochii]|uniref:helix-turn-helix domain-containing protein n=1 Tax=Cytobacillus kochii TaxID=859143 RepID=UPI001CD5DD0F|nr:helix-turn-helix transcriptional regulator [Cytobacillus kochii]MCA1027313.1 helix-turn-helix domain-containing protein [Cytobacillus kochii]
MKVNSFADFLKISRKKSGISSKNLARKVNKGDAYVSQIENGRNKNPDYVTAYKLLKAIGIDEANIEDILLQYKIFSPNKLTEEELAEESYITEKLMNDPSYQHEQTERQIEWLESVEKSIDKQAEEIKNELMLFANINIDKFQLVTSNLNKLILSMSTEHENYLFFTNLFSKDLTELNEESKKKIIRIIGEEIKKSRKENGWWGEIPDR